MKTTLSQQIEISFEERRATLDFVKMVLEVDYDTFLSTLNDGREGRASRYQILWVLKQRWDPEAIELYNKLDVSHRRKRRDEVAELNKKIKLKEMATNKDRFLSLQKYQIDEVEQWLRIVNEYTTELWSVVVVWLSFQAFKDGQYVQKFWWTTCIYEWITPGLYKEIKSTFKRYEEM